MKPELLSQKTVLVVLEWQKFTQVTNSGGGINEGHGVTEGLNRLRGSTPHAEGKGP